MKFENGVAFSAFLLLELQTVINQAVKELINAKVDFLEMYLDYFNDVESLDTIVGKITDDNLKVPLPSFEGSNDNIFDFLIRFVEIFYKGGNENA